ncbi:uncharacterized protein TNIN_218551 [Trichonephila inaurata madagascariensis]|uniref:WAP domain-containing protein n=1 Tax=Trichonephila inaurata madagascariensis TaxID=2747483 RepID=A0A8X6YRW2_9ARAC|nr:uncharacterized protein TNIN_22501 [Trichonephila inaurata madagascariensis]GFY78086.1 uncharacterized protein TNIN_218551 [Trichonephila inaurata madagascariensis]
METSFSECPEDRIAGGKELSRSRPLRAKKEEHRVPERCNAGVVSRNFKSNEIVKISVEGKETPRPTPNEILNTVAPVEQKNISEHLNSTSRDISNINSIPNVTHDEMVPNPQDSRGESSSSSRNQSEGGLRIETLKVNQPLNITSNEQDSRNSSNDTSPNVLRYENVSNFIEGIHKEKPSVDLNQTFLDHEMQLNGTNDFFPSKFLTHQTDTSTPQNLKKVSVNGKFEILATEKLNETKNPGGIFSGISLDFLINSEVARNAAKAMEVFNFTDPLTDHIFEENELHSFLDTKLPTSDSSHGAVNEDQTKSTSFNDSTEMVRNSTLTNKTILHWESEIFFNTSDSLKRNVTLLESNGSVLHERKGMLHPLHSTNRTAPNEMLEFFNGIDAPTGNGPVELPNVTQENDNLTEIPAGNVTLNLTKAFTENEMFHLTQVQLNKGSSAFENFSSTEKGSESKTDPKCPSPGFCILWFWSQNACEVDSHCLGSRICCRVRCSKTCIDVEKF